MQIQVDLTFEQMCLAEPGLLTLIAEAKLSRVRAETERPGNYIWLEYSRLKREMFRLAGWERPIGPEWMQTEEAYNVAIRALSDALGV